MKTYFMKFRFKKDKKDDRRNSIKFERQRLWKPVPVVVPRYFK